MKINIEREFKKIGLSIILTFVAFSLLLPSMVEANALHRNRINNIDEDIINIKNNGEKTEKKAIILNAEESKRVHELQREKLNIMNNNIYEELSLNEGEYMIVTGSSTMEIRKELKDIEKQVIYEEIKNVLDNIEIDEKYIEDLVFIVSPYELKGINGFTLARTKNNKLSQYIVISHSPGFLELGGEVHRELVRSTILHELGHTYKNKLEKEKGKHFEKNYRKYYAEIDISDVSKDDYVQQWKMSENENFAEDFRIYYSNKLNNYSFNPKAKKTKMPYNHKVHDLFQTYSKI